jgi:protein-tyrosine kinase
VDIKRLPIASEAGAPPAGRDRSLGALLVDRGRLTPADAEAVLRHAQANGLRFGDAAVGLGFVTAADVQHALAAQFDYPYLGAADETISKEVVAAFAPFSPAVEALRAVRTQLMLRWIDAAQPRRALAIVSPGRGEGRSYLAANLAVVFSQLGERTLLVDADLRNPRQHALFRLDEKFGLAALLAGRAPNGGAIHRIAGLVGLSVLPAGAAPPNPQELLGRPAFAALLADLAMQFDVILLDTPAASLGADFQTIAAAARGAIMVTRRDRTAAAAVRTVGAQLDDAGARLIGAVFNDH